MLEPIIKKKYTVIGLMSGTSLDGLDVALCHFEKSGLKWNYQIISAKTYAYDNSWKRRLSEAPYLNALDFIHFHKDFGKYSGLKVKAFLSTENTQVDFIASHGHTIFHQPEKGITFQSGDGYSIAAETGITTICDFRSGDVALGGQGAPLVPIGDELLFDEFDLCLNLGGFSNISFRKNGIRKAFDICPVNILINHYTRQYNIDFDYNGEIASHGKTNQLLLNELDLLEFYRLPGPKSLGREWVENEMITKIDLYSLALEDILRTVYQHIANQICLVIHQKVKEEKGNNSVLITGGGAFNEFLINLIKAGTTHAIIIPDKLTIDYKEALIFAFLGVLRIRNEINCLSSVTGAKKDSCGGMIYHL